MDLHNGSLFWPTTLDGEKTIKGRQEIDTHYDAVIVGGGMSGALTAFTLAQEGLHIAIVDKREMAAGSSSANTGLLQFSNDIMLHELIDQIGENQAVHFYKLCQKAVDQLKEVAETLPREADMIKRKSICYASTEEHVQKLQKEYEALSRHGFPAEYWTKADMKEHLPFEKPGALITHGDAEVNPYRFIQGILEYLEQKGIHLFENVEAKETEEQDDGILLHTSIGTFSASHLIYATGYDSIPINEKIGSDINRSYAIATEPIEDLSSWEDNAMIWETKRPYLYMRTTVDHRIIAGGLDEDKPEAPQSEEWIANRAERIQQELEKLFPDLPIKIAYAWGASFGESLDNLPFIGKHPHKNRQYYLLGYGGNGTVYSMLGSHIIRDLILDHPNEDAELVKLDR
ncbi:FAD-binding oxidoreductase [Fictibacillus sp. KIGAM418]|uniref:FAD-binding oxidoreductase n=1 Tax=Fictibacillus marinisediminis TaxID=2878389 RepID=A0A9X2BID9_9BACL|nr:FAD-dependent oxidoreductase [Fictibacillus marinisediminis]MCK6258508.1 FAD-binding oxidoreductase [Fictibacillus marinisediminis]